MKKKLKVICIIPARGGSKGIKLKNLQKVNNKPLIYYPIKAAIKSKVCDKICVSTDSDIIANISKKYGAEVPALRPRKFSRDFTSTEETLKNSLLQFEQLYGLKFDICVFLTATNIFRKVSWITQSVNYLKKNLEYESAFSVHKIYKHFWHNYNGNLKKVAKWMDSYTSRQIAPKLFREDTGLALASRAYLWRKGRRIGKKVKLIVNEDSFTGIDIHDKKDLFIADAAIKYLIKHKKNKDMIT
jgi:CMP-N,N'-diacetyllegionaminic acid synthase